jgi:hypothetical protein
MSQNDEKRQEILNLLAAGKITVDDAAAMLSGASQPEPIVEKQPEDLKDVDDLIKVDEDPGMNYVRKSGGKRPTWLRVRVSDMKTGKNKVMVNVPMGLVRFGMNVGSRFAPELEGFDWNDLSGALESDQGMLIDVEDEEDGERVQIFVE